MPPASDDIETRIQHAIDAYKRDNNSKITKIAREFNVPFYRFHSRLRGHSVMTAKHPVNSTLSKPQEEAVKHWIYQLDEASHAPTAQQVQECANSILRYNHDDPKLPPPQVSKMWAYQFIRRLPYHKCMKQKPMDLQRLKSGDPGLIQDWYDHLEVIMKDYQIQPSDLYDFDEIGFIVGQGRVENVVTQYPEKNENIMSFSRSSLTVIECISADGSVLSPCTILPGSNHLEDWYTHSDMPNYWTTAVSPSGFTTDLIALDWIHHFDIYSRKHQVSALLLFPLYSLFSIYLINSFFY